jgi:hypothetical protein
VCKQTSYPQHVISRHPSRPFLCKNTNPSPHSDPLVAAHADHSYKAPHSSSKRRAPTRVRSTSPTSSAELNIRLYNEAQNGTPMTSSCIKWGNLQRYDCASGKADSVMGVGSLVCAGQGQAFQWNGFRSCYYKLSAVCATPEFLHLVYLGFWISGLASPVVGQLISVLP